MQWGQFDARELEAATAACYRLGRLLPGRALNTREALPGESLHSIRFGVGPTMSIPLHVISGFLGSGKTTLLNRLLEDPSLSSALVLVNEFGEVGLDHLIVARMDEDTVLLRSGCVCCTVRDDLLGALGDVLERKRDGTVEDIDRVILETTGLADPGPIAATLGPHSPLVGQFHLDGLLVTVDALHARESLERHPEARAQIALADRLYLTKLDLAPDDEPALIDLLERANPRAEVFTPEDSIAPLELLSAGLVRPTSGLLDAGYWLAPAPQERQRSFLLQEHAHVHSDVSSFVIRVPGELNEKHFIAWVALFSQMNGDRVLRIKALLSIAGEDGFLAVDAIRSFVHPPTLIPRAKSAPRNSTIVFIVQGFTKEEEGAIRQAVESTATAKGNPLEP